MQDRNTVTQSFSAPIPLEVLSELGRATTVYHQATPDRVESARQAYEEALRKFKASVETERTL